jgi:hypothetical protein
MLEHQYQYNQITAHPHTLQAAAAPAPSGAIVPSYAGLLPVPRGSGKGTISLADSSSTLDTEAVVLVEQNGSVFGIPAAHVTFDVASLAEAGAAAAAQAQCRMPEAGAQRLPLPAAADEPGDKALQPVHLPAAVEQQGLVEAQASGQCRPPGKDSSDGMCAAALLGVHTVQPRSPGGLLLLPPAPSEADARPQEQQQQGSSWQWVVLSAALAFTTSAMAVAMWVLRRQAALQMQQQQQRQMEEQQQQQRRQQAAEDASSASPASTKGRRRAGANGRRSGGGQQVSNRLKGLVHQAALEDSGGAGRAAENAANASSTAQQQQQQQQQQHVAQPADGVSTGSAGVTEGPQRSQRTPDGAILVGRLKVRRDSVRHSQGSSGDVMCDVFLIVLVEFQRAMLL